MERDFFKLIHPLFAPYRLPAALMIGLGVIEILLEGIGISLFLPFINLLSFSTLSVEGSGPFEQFLTSIIDLLPANQRLILIPLLIFSLILLKNVVSLAAVALSAWIDMDLSRRLASQSYTQLMSVSMSYMESHRAGEMHNTIVNEASEINSAVSTILGMAVNLCAIVILLSFLLVVSWPLTLMAIAGLIFTSMLIRLVTQRVESFAEEAIEREEEQLQSTLEMLNNMLTIRILGRSKYAVKRVEKIVHQVSALYFKSEMLTALIYPLIEILIALLLVGLLFVMATNLALIPKAIIFVAILYRLLPHMTDFDEARTELLRLYPSLQKVTAFLGLPDKETRRTGGVHFDELRESIQFRNVTFRYQDEAHSALTNVSLTIPKGKTVAIIGKSGAGKSTLTKLLLGVYEPSSGAIWVDKYPLNQIDMETWRNQVGFVHQDSQLFHASIRDNIRYGRLDATQEELVTAATVANAHAFITNLPDGYDTQLGDHGVGLSAGQRQRIALARALVRQPHILILDEATNSLDIESESTFYEQLKRNSSVHTLVIITHRLSTIQNVDTTIAIEGGQVADTSDAIQDIEPELLNQHHAAYSYLTLA
ncbi:MAG: ATP-binding cassette domain-containing protein [Chloroflexota bacterium]